MKKIYIYIYGLLAANAAILPVSLCSCNNSQEKIVPKKYLDIKHDQLLGFIDGNTPSDLSSYNVLQVPSYVTSIANNAFDGVIQENSHIKLKFEKNSHCSLIGECAFRNCGGLTSVELPTCLTSLQNNCFENCMNVEHITGGDFKSSISYKDMRTFSSVIDVYNKKFNEILNCNFNLNGTQVSWIDSLNKLSDKINDILSYAEANGLPELANLCNKISEDINHVLNKCCSDFLCGELSKLKDCIDFNYSDSPNVIDNVLKNLYSCKESFNILMSDIEILSKYHNTDQNAYAWIFGGDLSDANQQGWVNYVCYKGLTFHETSDTIKYSIANIFENQKNITVVTGTQPVNFICAIDQIVLGCNSSSQIDLNNYWNYGLDPVINYSTWIGIIYVYEQLSQLNYLPSSLKNIGESCFKNNEKIEFFNFGNSPSLGSIGNNLFENCTNMIFYTLPDEITSIPSYMFCNCNNILDVIFNNSQNIKDINEYAFYNCKKLNFSLYWNPNFENINSYAFSNVASLTSINLNSALKTIGSNAFSSTNISNICFYGFSSSWTIPLNWDKTAFDNISSVGIINCVDGSISAADMLTRLKAKYSVFENWN